MSITPDMKSLSRLCAACNGYTAPALTPAGFNASAQGPAAPSPEA